VENKDVNYWISMGEELYRHGNFEEAVRYYNNAIELDPNNPETHCNLGMILSLKITEPGSESFFVNACNEYHKATQLNPGDIRALVHWGYLLCLSVMNKQNTILFSEELKKYEKASDCVNLPTVLLSKGELYFTLGQMDKAIGYFKNSQESILDILVFLDTDNREKIIKIDTLYSLLDSDSWDGRFFKETTKNIPNKNDIDKYKKVYILSIFIMNLLHVRNEKYVAHYQKKKVSQKILFDDKESKFRLNAINYSNDPTEGKTLLDYLWGEEKYNAKDTSNKEYGAFAGCFTLNQDSLHQFRLYGKEDREEGVGLSLVFRDSFFSKKAKMAMKQEDDNFKKEEKYALFRCMYIDPIVRRVVTVGRKEEYLFYRDENINKDVIDKYNNYISEVLEDIRDKMEELKESVKGLDSAVIGRLLLNLRYLTKHVAFKEEQECRIVKICRLTDEKIRISSNEDQKKMYIDYEPKVSDHIEKIYFGPKATEMELFQDILTNKRLNIPCKKSENSLA
jgi:tetratricopeptide (TPR) repeat protein